MTEVVARAIWEDQRRRLRNPDGINGRISWRSKAVPDLFWDGYVLDARAALSAIRSEATS